VTKRPRSVALGSVPDRDIEGGGLPYSTNHLKQTHPTSLVWSVKKALITLYSFKIFTKGNARGGLLGASDIQLILGSEGRMNFSPPKEPCQTIKPN